MTPISVSINKNNIVFKSGDEDVVYKTDVNAFLEDTGLTIQNVTFPIESEKVFYIKLSDKTSTFNCGNSLDNILLEIEREVDSGLLIINFKDVEEVSSYFLKEYTKFLLRTKNKIITINMSPLISNDFGDYIEQSILEDTEE